MTAVCSVIFMDAPLGWISGLWAVVARPGPQNLADLSSLMNR